MKFPFIVNDVANLLVEFYINYRHIQPSERAMSTMKLRMKEALVETYKCLYEDTEEEIWSISVVIGFNLKTYEFNHDVQYDIMSEMIMDDIRRDLYMIIPSIGQLVNPARDVIVLSCVPFDGLSLSTNDITDLLDLYSM